MSSRNYTLFERAMRLRKPVFCLYDGYPRELCPIILGHSQGEEKRSPINSAAKASQACRMVASGVASHYQGSATQNCTTDPGAPAPATATRNNASTPLISM